MESEHLSQRVQEELQRDERERDSERDAREGERKMLWVDRYTPRKYTELISDEVRLLGLMYFMQKVHKYGLCVAEMSTMNTYICLLLLTSLG